MRLIDADALHRFGNRKGLIHSRDVDNAPTVDPVKHGHWIEIDRGLLWQCSVCEHHSISGGYYCDWCGAKMDEVEEDG